jgi:hypothetical protein
MNNDLADRATPANTENKILLNLAAVGTGFDGRRLSAAFDRRPSMAMDRFSWA